MNIATEKITIRWLIDHVPIKYWIGAFAFSVTMFGAGITFSKYSFVSDYFKDLTFPENNIKTNDLKIKNQELEKKNNEISLKYEKKLKEDNILKIELEGNKKIKNKLLQENTNLKNILSEDKELKNNLLENNRLLQIEINSLKDKLKKFNSSIHRKYNLTTDNSVSNIKQDKKINIIAKHKAALKIPGSVTQTDALKVLAEEAADLKLFEIAFNIALDIIGTTTRSETLSYIALKTAKNGDIEYATKVAEKIPGSTTKSSTLAKILKM